MILKSISVIVVKHFSAYNIRPLSFLTLFLSSFKIHLFAERVVMDVFAFKSLKRIVNTHGLFSM